MQPFLFCVKYLSYIFILSALLLLSACNGSKKYFKAAERLEKQGLVQEAADYYLQSLQRKPGNIDARIKLKEVGQKHVSNLSSEFFRLYNTQQTETSLGTFERLKEYVGRCKLLDVQLEYPAGYEEDYQKAIETYIAKYYARAHAQVNQRNFKDALSSIANVQRYRSNYKTVQKLEIIATCEPLYQMAVSAIESKNYESALNNLKAVTSKSDTYKDSKELFELASAQLNRSVILFQPVPASNPVDKQLQTQVYDNIIHLAFEELKTIQVINNSPFQNASSTINWSNNTNVDLVQAIRKASGADYFYIFDVLNRREYFSGLNKTPNRGYEEVVKRVNDTTTITEYRAIDYNLVKASRTYSFDYRYKIINTANNQIIASQTQQMRGSDGIEYNEFQKAYSGNINKVFPYNPTGLAQASRYNPTAFRRAFTGRKELKSFDALKAEALTQAGNYFKRTTVAFQK
jgi:hypothetical protein